MDGVLGTYKGGESATNWKQKHFWKFEVDELGKVSMRCRNQLEVEAFLEVGRRLLIVGCRWGVGNIWKLEAFLEVRSI